MSWNWEAGQKRICLVCKATTNDDDLISPEGICRQCELGTYIIRPRVFCASMADWLDDEVPIAWLADLLQLIHQTPNLDWLLLTKRPENFGVRVLAAAMYMAGYRDGQASDNPTQPQMKGWELGHEWIVRKNPPKNVWIGTTTENQEMADKRVPELLNIPANIRFLSVEPMLGPINLSGWMEVNRIMAGYNDKSHAIHWVICGGESGHAARPMSPDWARNLRDQCAHGGIPFFFKQWGEWLPASSVKGPITQLQFDANGPTGPNHPEWHDWPDGWRSARVGKKAAGRLLDGFEHSQFPS